MKRYEMVREIFNSCSGNQMRDVFISEIETDDMEASLQQFLTGKEVHYERFENAGGAVIFNIDTDGMNQRVTFTEI